MYHYSYYHRHPLTDWEVKKHLHWILEQISPINLYDLNKTLTFVFLIFKLVRANNAVEIKIKLKTPNVRESNYAKVKTIVSS